MAGQYDLVVIGSGAAANAAATQVRAAGRRVAVIDYRPFGGTCALRGCDPKKVLVGGTEALDHVRRMLPHGLAGDLRIDWPKLMAFKRSFTDPVPGQMASGYGAKGIDAYRGHARFTGRNTLQVDGETLQAQHILLATGAGPVPLNIPGEQYLITNEEFLALETLPRRIVTIGGGYIAAEFSHIAARAGAAVTILQRAQRMLELFDADLVAWLMPAFATLGIDVRTGVSVERIEKAASGLQVAVSVAGARSVIEADLAIHAAGRVPCFEGLDLEAAGIDTERGRLKLNDYLQSVSNPSVYAAGDAAHAGPPLTPIAARDADVAAGNILRGNHLRPDYRAVPTVAFTIPPIAAVGLDESRARAQGIAFNLHSRHTGDWFTARQQAEPVAGFKVLVDENTDLILGAHLLGPHAEEVINVFALAMRHGLTAAALKDTVFAYPTAASDIASML